MDRDPVRLLDDESAGAGLRDALGRAAETMDPPLDVTPGLAKLKARIETGPRGGPGGPLAWTAGGLACAIGLLAATRWIVPPNITREASPATVAEPHEIVAPPGAGGATESTNAAEVPPAAPPETTAVSPRAPAMRPSSVSHRADEEKAGLPGPDEIAQLAEVRAESRVDPSGTLALAAEGDRRFPHGQLHQEREALAIEALVKLGRVGEARTRAERFVAMYPRSAFNDRLRGLVAP